MRRHTYHEEHHHMPSVWSGVYYVQISTEEQVQTQKVMLIK